MRLLLLRRIKLKTLNEAIDVVRQKKQFSKKKIKNEHIGVGQTLIGYKSETAVYTEDNAKHIFICGTTGSGKTVAISNYIKSAVDKDYPLLLIDGKGDINENSMLDIVQKLKGNKKLYVINMVDPIRSDKYNPFMGANPTTCKDMLVNMTEWSEEHYKANTERYLERLIRLLNFANIPLTFKNIIDYMPSKKLDLLSAKLNKEGVLDKDEHMSNLELIKTSGAIANSACARFSLIQESEIGNIFDDNGIDIHKALSEKAIILFILNPLSYPELSPLLGRLILIDSKKAVSKMFTHKIAERLFFIMDEINVYASPILIDLINKSRSAGVTCIPATQSLADLEYISGEAFKNQIIENCNNYIIMRQNSNINAEKFANIIGTRHSMNLTYQIKSDDSGISDTGMGSMRATREFLYHPDEIKNLKTGEAIYVSKDSSYNSRVNINKPY